MGVAEGGGLFVEVGGVTDDEHGHLVAVEIAGDDLSDVGFGDFLDFLLEGVPTLVANQEVANYMQNYHAASDTFDKVDIRELKLNTVLAAVTAWGIADRPEPIGKRQSRAEVEALLKETGLDKELRRQDMWNDFETGARGRQP